MTNQNKIKILIVEDEILIADFILDILQESNFKTIKIANDYHTALSLMESFLPEIILMDINLNSGNTGIELSKLKNKNATVIFITGQYDFASMSEALKTNPDAYLTKPIKKVDLLASINLALHKKQIKTLQFRDGYDTVKLEFDAINYIVADGNYINIHTNSKKYTIRQSLNTIAEQLPDNMFIKTHRSYLVNESKIERITSNSVLVNNIEVPLSRTFAKQLK